MKDYISEHAQPKVIVRDGKMADTCYVCLAQGCGINVWTFKMADRNALKHAQFVSQRWWTGMPLSVFSLLQKLSV